MPSKVGCRICVKTYGYLYLLLYIVEELLQKKNPSETKREKRCIVSPEIEVTILHNANLDLEVINFSLWSSIDFVKTEKGGD